MALSFSRLKSEMDYFEQADSLSIESFLDLMFDLYSDVSQGIGFGPGGCYCEDCDILAANLVWLGNTFQQIYRTYERDIAQTNSEDRTHLSRISLGMKEQIAALQAEKESRLKEQEQIAALQKQKQNLEAEIALLKMHAADLMALENRIQQLEADKDREEAKWTKVRQRRQDLEDEINRTQEEINTANTLITEDLTPRLTTIRNELSARNADLSGLNDQIRLGDEEIRKLNDQITALGRDIENSDKQNILQRLNSRIQELSEEKQSILDAKADIAGYDRDILIAKQKKEEIRQNQQAKKTEWEQLTSDLEQLEAEFVSFCATESRYTRQKRRYHSLKASVDQLRKDSAILCKRTAMEPFSLDEELERAMVAIGNYLTSVAGAIDKYSRQAEDSL